MNQDITFALWFLTLMLPVAFAIGYHWGCRTERLVFTALVIRFGHLPERLRDEIAHRLKGTDL